MHMVSHIRSARPAFLVVALGALALAAARAAPLVKIENCTLIQTPWADGDSFQIQIPAKEADQNGPGHKARRVTLRLYGADCIESKIHDTTDGRRLRAQRRYFGISKNGSAEQSIKLALKYGNLATEETRRLLAKPFTVYTGFADARGDPNFKRYYGFVKTADGADLAAALVSKGLARAFGVYRATYDGRSGKDYRAQLADLELQAAKKGLGVWSQTNWNSLPEERRAQRDEEREINIGIAGKHAPPTEKIHVNKASRDQLMRLPGVGEVTANRIIEGRPFRKPADLTRVSGIGEATLKRLRPYLIFPDGK